jgi:hypothetical protein
LLNKAAAFRNITVSELEERWNTARTPYGTPDKVLERFAGLADVGVTKYYLQWFDLPDRTAVEEQVELAAGLKL